MILVMKAGWIKELLSRTNSPDWEVKEWQWRPRSETSFEYESQFYEIKKNK